MERREFFADRPLWLRILPLMGIVLLLFAPIAFLQIHGAVGPPDSPLQAGMLSFAVTTAVAGTVYLALFLLLLVRASRLNIPELVLDEKGLRTPLVLFGWPLIGEVWVAHLLARPVLCISMIKDEAVMKRIPAFLRLRYAIRRRIVGAPIALPTMRDISLQDLCNLIDEYRTHFNQLENP